MNKNKLNRYVILRHNIMTKSVLLTFWICILISYVGSAQILNESYKLNKTVPMAPEAAKFANYYMTPSVSATGTVPIEIPLYELEEDGVTIPITITYHTAGLKVTDLSGSVGLGWSLNVGGGIYRSINGQPDDYIDASTSTFLNPLYPVSDYIGPFVSNNTYKKQAAINFFAENSIDLNQDNYSYNFLNHTGGLFFNDKFQFKEINRSELDFTYDSKKLNVLFAKDKRGNVFNFDVKEQSTNTFTVNNSTSNFSKKVFGTTSWKLGNIKTVHNKQINFSYIDYYSSIQYPSSSMLYYLNTPSDLTDCFAFRKISSTTFSDHNNLNKLIDTVYSDNFTVKFSYLDDSKASNWTKKLDKIEVKNRNGEIVKLIKFEYSYFAGDPRLKLSKVIFEAINGEDKSVYSFLYNDDQPLPQVNSMAKDLFGFYNGRNNGTLLSIANNLPGLNFTAAQREVDEYFLKIGSLREIIYPTKGSLKLSYSANSKITNENISYSPGLRVEKMELLDENDSIVNTKFYKYSDILGVNIRFPAYAVREQPVSGQLFISDLCYSYNSEVTGQVEHYPSNFFYQKVTIREISEGKESITEEYYDDPVPYITQEPLEGYVFQPILLRKELYNGKIKIKTEYFNYTPILSSGDIANIYDLRPPYLTHINIYNENGKADWVTCYNYQPGPFIKKTLQSKWLRYDGKWEIYHFENGKEYDISTGYFYDNPKHMHPTRIRIWGSKGEKTEQNIKYPQDMVASSEDPLGTYQFMYSKNITSTPIVSLHDTQGKINGSMNEYSKSESDFPILSAVKIFNGLTNQFENRIRFHAYDKNGNVLDQQYDLGPRICFLWGYGGQYPIAEIKNATYADVLAVLTQTTINNLNAVNVTEATITTAMNKLRTDTRLAKAMVTSYTYQPLVGMRSKTDTRGVTEFYEYDGMQRLKAILDDVKNVTSSMDYHYRPN